MEEQTAKSAPLYDESEEEKRRRLAAQNYLSAKNDYAKAGIGDSNQYSMSRDAYRSSDPGQAGGLGKTLNNATESALNSGIGGPLMAQEALNKPQARIVGDTLVGKAAGISTSEWDKRDKSVASGNNPLMPTREMYPLGNGGAMADAATKERYDASVAASSKAEADRAKSFSDTFTKYQAGVDAKNRKLAGERRAAMTPEASKARFDNFKSDIADRESLNAMAAQDLEMQRRYAYNARLAERSLRQYARRGGVVSPEAMEKASRMVAASKMGLGPSRDSNDRLNLFKSRITNGTRLNPNEDFATAADRGEAAVKPTGSPTRQVSSSPTDKSSGNPTFKPFGLYGDEDYYDSKKNKKRSNT